MSFSIFDYAPSQHTTVSSCLASQRWWTHNTRRQTGLATTHRQHSLPLNLPSRTFFACGPLLGFLGFDSPHTNTHTHSRRGALLCFSTLASANFLLLDLVVLPWGHDGTTQLFLYFPLLSVAADDSWGDLRHTHTRKSSQFCRRRRPPLPRLVVSTSRGGRNNISGHFPRGRPWKSPEPKKRSVRRVTFFFANVIQFRTELPFAWPNRIA